MENPKIWYMLETHGFRRLSLNVEDAINELRMCFYDGNGYGMVCSRDPGMPEHVHAYGWDKWNEFEAEVREYYRKWKEK
jgi:hypothetical protein